MNHVSADLDVWNRQSVTHTQYYNNASFIVSRNITVRNYMKCTILSTMTHEGQWLYKGSTNMECLAMWRCVTIKCNGHELALGRTRKTRKYLNKPMDCSTNKQIRNLPQTTAFKIVSVFVCIQYNRRCKQHVTAVG